MAMVLVIPITAHLAAAYGERNGYPENAALDEMLTIEPAFDLRIIGMASLGTMGAFIRIKETIYSRVKYFDVGVSGPIAGFVVAVILLIYGFQNLPDTEYIYEMHPEYELFGRTLETTVKLQRQNFQIPRYDMSRDTK